MRISVDDACSSDIRLADICSKYEIECIFYWPVEWQSLAYAKGYKPLDIFEALTISKQFEVGSHSITHRLLTQIPIDEALIEIADSKVILSNMFNQAINKFCPPRGYTNKELTDYTLSLYNSQRLTKGKGLVHVHPNSGANGNIHWLDYAKKNEITEVWTHSWELDKYDEWDNLERFLNEYSHSKLRA